MADIETLTSLVIERLKEKYSEDLYVAVNHKDYVELFESMASRHKSTGLAGFDVINICGAQVVAVDDMAEPRVMTAAEYFKRLYFKAQEELDASERLNNDLTHRICVALKPKEPVPEEKMQSLADKFKAWWSK